MKNTRPEAVPDWAGLNPQSVSEQGRLTQQGLDHQRRWFIYPAWAGLSRLRAPTGGQGVIQTWLRKHPVRGQVGYDLYQFAVLANQAQREGREAHAINLIEAIYAACDAAAA
jgi:hypothetical protein